MKLPAGLFRPMLLRPRRFVSAREFYKLSGGMVLLTPNQRQERRNRINDFKFVSTRYELHRLGVRLSRLANASDQHSRRLAVQCAHAVNQLKATDP